MKYKKIGIIGGMGPEATAKLYFRIIEIFQKIYGAKLDSDFPEIILVNLPIPDVVEKVSSELEIQKMMIDAAKRVESAGANFIVIPCNTVSYFIPKIRTEVSIPIFNTVAQTAKKTLEYGSTNIGIIGTKMTLRKGIYSKYLPKRNLIIPTESEQETVTKIIMNILAGNKTDLDKKILNEIVQNLKNKGAQKIILGCTELPLLIQGPDLIDSLDILAKICVEEAVK